MNTKTLGYFLLAIVVSFFVGVIVGISPTEEESTQADQQAEAVDDLITVSNHYRQVYYLCEQKYQMALNGDLFEAVRVNGQMDSLLVQIGQILDKYQLIAK